MTDQDKITFDKFLQILKATENQMAATQPKPNIENYKEIKASASQIASQPDELIIELDTKVMDFLRYKILRKIQ